MARRDLSAFAKRLINAFVSWNDSSPSESHFMQKTPFFGVRSIELPLACAVTICPHNLSAMEKILRSLGCDSCDSFVIPCNRALSPSSCLQRRQVCWTCPALMVVFLKRRREFTWVNRQLQRQLHHRTDCFLVQVEASLPVESTEL